MGPRVTVDYRRCMYRKPGCRTLQEAHAPDGGLLIADRERWGRRREHAIRERLLYGREVEQSPAKPPHPAQKPAKPMTTRKIDLYPTFVPLCSARMLISLGPETKPRKLQAAA